MSEERRVPKKLTPEQWAEAQTLWEIGNLTLDELAEKFGVDRSTMYRRFKTAGVERGAKAGQVAEKVQQQILDETAAAAAEEALKLAARKKATKEDCYAWIEQIQKATMAEIVKAARDKTPFGVIKGNLQALEKAMNVIASGRRERFELLGLDREEMAPDDLPDLLIRELTADEIHQLQSSDEDDFDEMDELPDVVFEEIEELLDDDQG
ncbi:helix-turn-helix domain-containing protein [Magnetospirillum molischianum]|uniref:Uncharacterized protein n=1 Tax=Magnetospirillum molischianum DSM 120 TaxID=1150626 RepID=H8FY42_MAGML|nr:hypothetical protein [Magnetospirillum molischianum]CCG43280.1 hypothetical protein PHAMO_80071 [Magnetospirillum molischianum DSM 120]